LAKAKNNVSVDNTSKCIRQICVNKLSFIRQQLLGRASGLKIDLSDASNITSNAAISVAAAAINNAMVLMDDIVINRDTIICDDINASNNNDNTILFIHYFAKESLSTLKNTLMKELLYWNVTSICSITDVFYLIPRVTC